MERRWGLCKKFCNMFCRLIFLALIAVAAAHSPTTPAAADTYDTKFDNIDIDEILASDRLLRNYVRCLEREAPCTPDGKMLQEILPDAVSTGCVKCSEKQRIGSEKVTHYLIDNKPEDWERLEKLYDPQGEYRKAYLKEKAMVAKAQEAGIKIR